MYLEKYGMSTVAEEGFVNDQGVHCVYGAPRKHCQSSSGNIPWSTFCMRAGV